MNEVTKNQIIVVLASAPGRLTEVTRFLGRRGWEIKMRSDLKAFVADVAASKPCYVLMSADFSHPNTGKLRTLMETVYQVKVIDFAEENTIEGANRLRAIPGVNKIYGELTGPALERAILRISAETVQANRAGAERILQQGSGDTLRKALAVGDGVVKKPLTLTTRVTCVQVRTSVLSGYFLIAMGSDKTLDEAILANLKNAIAELYKKVGFPAPLEESFEVEVRRVEFKKWALATASFLERSVHDGMEVAMAFIPIEEETFHLEDSGHDGMGVIDLDEIAAESKVDFEIYLHLPLNKKFVLYVSKGGWMSLQQQLNLQGRGISRLHVKKSESALIFRARTHRHLDRMIADYYENGGVGFAA